MIVLALDAALGGAAAAIVADDAVVAQRSHPGDRGQAGVLGAMVAALFEQTGLEAADLDGICATVGPGSFTGLRAALALAQGLALAAGRPAVGVTVAEALAEALPRRGGRPLWTAIDSRRGQIFLDIDGTPAAVALTALPRPAGPVAVCGDAAILVAATLAARGADVMLTNARLPLPRHVAVVGARRLRGEIAPLPARPLYVDPPLARPPAAGPRPAPLGLAAAIHTKA